MSLINFDSIKSLVGEAVAFLKPLPDQCTQLMSEDKEAADLCYLLKEYGIKEISTDLKGKVYNPQQTFTKLTPQAVYYKAAEVIENEIYQLGEISPEDEKKLFSYKARQKGFWLPWLLYDESYRLYMKAKINNTLANKPIATRYEQAQSIYEDSFDPLGFGLIVWENLPYETDLLGTLKTRFGDCSEISRTLYSSYRLGGFYTEFVWVKKDICGDYLLHMATKIHLDEEGRDVIADSHYGFDVQHEVVVPMPLLTSLAVFYDNMGYEKMAQNPQEAYDDLKRAIKYDPTYPITYIHLSFHPFTSEEERQELLEQARNFDKDSDIYLDVVSNSRHLGLP